MATRNLVDLVDRTKTQIKNIKQSGLGLTGKVARGLNDFAAELHGISDLIGGTEWIGDKQVPAGSLLDPSQYEWVGPLAGVSAAVLAKRWGRTAGQIRRIIRDSNKK